MITFVIPAHAGIHCILSELLDSGLRRNDVYFDAGLIVNAGMPRQLWKTGMV